MYFLDNLHDRFIYHFTAISSNGHSLTVDVKLLLSRNLVEYESRLRERSLHVVNLQPMLKYRPN